MELEVNSTWDGGWRGLGVTEQESDVVDVRRGQRQGWRERCLFPRYLILGRTNRD